MKVAKKNFLTKQIVLFLTALFLLVSLAVLCPLSKKSVLADETISDDQVIGHGTDTFDIEDDKLYSKLWQIYQENGGTKDYLTVGSFKTLTTLDLSSTELDQVKIKSLKGLGFFKFDSLTSLNLSGNEITSKIDGFQYMTMLQNLDLSGNKITYFDASDFLSLQNVNLKNNSLAYANISTIKEGGLVDLSFNNLDSFDKIVLPQGACTVNLTHNMLTGEVPSTTSTLNMGFQGVKNAQKLTKESVIKFYGLENVDSVKIYKIVDDSKTLVYTMQIDEENPVFTLTNLAIGNYSAEFEETSELDSYQNITFSVVPVGPVAVVKDLNGDILNVPYIIKTHATVTLESDSGEIFYSINNGETVKGNTIKIDSNGSFTIKFWTVEDGFASESETVLVICQYTNPLSIVWVLVGMIAIAIIFYIGYVWRENVGKKKTSSKNTNKGFN